MSYPGFSYAKKGLLVRLAYLFIALLNLILRRVLGRADGVVVLCYHSVLPEQRASFDRQMQYVANRVVPLVGVEGLSDKDSAVVVTFDDAFGCLLDNVIPAVRHHCVPIAIFAVSENLGKPPLWLSGSGHPDASLPTMTAEQLQTLATVPGLLIGSHSARHRRLGDLATADVKSELATSKSVLEGVLGMPCRYLALPHGSYRPEVIDLALHHGYHKILTLDEIALPSRWPIGTVGRFSASPDMWMIEFMLTVHGAYAWLFSWRAWIRQLKSSFTSPSHAG
jgi:peptidoglycan/xylan/chitin deacetylase (PgdA/CDA1 family)